MPSSADRRTLRTLGNVTVHRQFALELSTDACRHASAFNATIRSPDSWSVSVPSPRAEDGWTVVGVKATSLNHHDLWSLKGVGLREDQLPMVLGTDAAGIDEDGNEVVIHAVIGGSGSRWRRRNA